MANKFLFVYDQESHAILCKEETLKVVREESYKFLSDEHNDLIERARQFERDLELQRWQQNQRVIWEEEMRRQATSRNIFQQYMEGARAHEGLDYRCNRDTRERIDQETSALSREASRLLEGRVQAESNDGTVSGGRRAWAPLFLGGYT